jgi:hypothetical protein
MGTIIEWQTGTPKTPDLYVVTIKLGENSGYQTFVNWDGEQWCQSSPENVIAFFPANELIRKIDLNWPEPDVIEHDDSDLPVIAAQDWELYVEDTAQKGA